MHKIIILIASCALVFGLGMTSSYAGCKMTIEIVNKTNRSIIVDKKKSKVKIKGGTWRKIGKTTTEVRKGEKVSIPYNATFGCKKKRQYRISWSGQGEGGTKYHPSTTGFTTSQTVTINIK